MSVITGSSAGRDWKEFKGLTLKHLFWIFQQIGSEKIKTNFFPQKSDDKRGTGKG